MTYKAEHVYDAIASVPDERDHRAKAINTANLPPTVALPPVPVLDQGAEGACHDDKTEVLTDRGWQRWGAWDGNDPLGTINPFTHALEFQTATERFSYRYAGDLVVSDNSRVNFALTPNHRMLVRKWDEKARTLASDYSFVEAGRLGWYTGLLHAPSGWVGSDFTSLSIGERVWDGDDFLSLVALVVADGWVGGTDNHKNVVSFCCMDERYLSVASFAARLGFREEVNRRGVWMLQDGALASWFRANAGTDGEFRSDSKRIPLIVKIASQRQIAHFLDWYADQTISGDARYFFTVSRHLADDIQELVFRIGRRGTISEREPRRGGMIRGREIVSTKTQYVIYEAKTDRLSLERKQSLRVEPYDGFVHCATVPNGILVTRRENDVLISGNCVGHGCAGARETLELIANGSTPVVPLSRAFIYYEARKYEHAVSRDSGAFIRDGCRVLKNLGAPPESVFPYTAGDFAKRPPFGSTIAAAAFKIKGYTRLVTPDEIRAALAGNQPVVAGIAVYESFERNIGPDGVVPLPDISREELLGGHCIFLTGYHPDPRYAGQFIWDAQNSWGTAFGDAGKMHFPQEYIADQRLTSDLWSIS